MTTTYTVKQGDCLSNIAYRYKVRTMRVWNDPANETLRKKRKNPNILFPGDIIHIPDKETREESGATETRHR